MAKNWREFLASECQKPYYQDLKKFVEEEYSEYTVYPDHKNILRALELTPLSKVKVVILGQDPYHEPGQAMGLSFSVPDGVKIPPSLVNIYKEITDELGGQAPESGDLTRWAKQGVLLLNTVLTVREHEANSHAGHGWEIFMDSVIDEVCKQPQPLVFMLWGKPAQEKSYRIVRDATKGKYGSRLVLTTSHPSPLSAYRGFLGSGVFKACNDFLMENGVEPIQWN